MALIESRATPAEAPVDQPHVGPATPSPEVGRATGADGHRRLLWLGLAAVVVALIVTPLGIANRHTLAHQVALSLTQQPTPYTELYFTDPGALPAASSLPAPGEFSFTIVNHEGRSTAYPYTVTVVSDTGANVAAHGTMPLDSGTSGAEQVGYTPAPLSTTYVVTVTLIGRPESIHFRNEPA